MHGPVMLILCFSYSFYLTFLAYLTYGPLLECTYSVRNYGLTLAIAQPDLGRGARRRRHVAKQLVAFFLSF